MNESQSNTSHSAKPSEDVDSTSSTFVGSPESLKFRGSTESWRDVDIEVWSQDGRGNAETYDVNNRNHLNDERISTADFEPLLECPRSRGPVDSNDGGAAPTSTAKEKPVSWSDLPKRSQLALLTLARLSEPLAQTSLQSYMFYQLKSFQPSPSDETVAFQAGVLTASFTGAQFLTAMAWGRLADSERVGRKMVILVGLVGTAIGSLGFGFSQSFAVAVFWRCFAGLLNGNIGVMRAMISEMIQERKYQSRAFLLLPMTFNVGVVIGPLLGGWLSTPAESYPSIFGEVQWMIDFPYALPNVVSACFLASSAVALTLGLEETHERLRSKPDLGLRISRWIAKTILRTRPTADYAHIAGREIDAEDMELSLPAKKETATFQQKLPFRRIWTSNVLFTLLSHGLLACHVGTFNSLWFVFLSTPRYGGGIERRSAAADIGHIEPINVPDDYQQRLPLVFTGGLALPPSSIGTALAILGVIGITLQLLLYPKLSWKLGNVKSLRFSLLLFPLTYFLAPFLAIVPSSQPPPGQATGVLVWVCIAFVLLIQVTARTFALPASAIIVNNSSPHPSVLGTLHGIAQSVSSATRTVGPILGGYLYSVGLQEGIVGLGWWSIAGLACIGAVAGYFVRDGSGHEIVLEGEE